MSIRLKFNFLTRPFIPFFIFYSFVVVCMGFNFNGFSDLSADLRKTHNIIGSPDWLCDQALSNIPADSTATYLDPCVGRGAFIEGLLRIGVNEEQITACDVVQENVDWCKAIWKNVNYITQDLLRITDHYDYVVGTPPWFKSTPAMLFHLASIADKKCMLVAPFFHGNWNYRNVESLVVNFYPRDFNTLVRNAINSYPFFGVPCFYELSTKCNSAGLHEILTKWVEDNSLGDCVTLDRNSTVGKNLVSYDEQKHFLFINHAWFLHFIHGTFKVSFIKKLSILGRYRPGKTNYGLVYSSQEELNRAREHYSSVKVRKLLSCGVKVGWDHLKYIQSF